MPLRDHLEKAARAGAPDIQAQLDGPECPPRLRGLLRVAKAVHGRSGLSPHGSWAPVTYTTIRHYRIEYDLARFDEDELDAIIALDAVMLNPDAGKEIA